MSLINTLSLDSTVLKDSIIVQQPKRYTTNNTNIKITVTVVCFVCSPPVSCYLCFLMCVLPLSSSLDQFVHSSIVFLVLLQILFINLCSSLCFWFVLFVAFFFFFFSFLDMEILCPMLSFWSSVRTINHDYCISPKGKKNKTICQGHAPSTSIPLPYKCKAFQKK